MCNNSFTSDVMMKWSTISTISQCSSQHTASPILDTNVEVGADPSQFTHRSQCHKQNGKLPLLSARPTVTFPAIQYHRPVAITKLYSLLMETRVNNCPESLNVVQCRESNSRSSIASPMP